MSVATLSTPSVSTPNPESPVPLDTIPVSPPGEASDENSPPDGVAKRQYSDVDEVTVFHDPENFNVKHPLMNKWTLWFTKPASSKGQDWNELLKEVITFASVEEFWGVYNNIAPVSDLAIKSDYHLFKHGIRPEWEDPNNKHGGKWSYSFVKQKGNVPINDLWLWVMLAAIGETLENDGDGEVMGVVVNVRKGFWRIGVWTKTTGKYIPNAGDGDVPGGRGRGPEKSRKILEGIGSRFKDTLKLEPEEKVEFSGHTEAAAAGSTRAKPKFSV